MQLIYHVVSLSFYSSSLFLFIHHQLGCNEWPNYFLIINLLVYVFENVGTCPDYDFFICHSSHLSKLPYTTFAAVW